MEVLRKEDKKALIQNIAEVLPHIEEIKIAYIYGSLLERDDFRDIDIALVLEDKGLDPHTIFELSMKVGTKAERKIKPRYPCDARVLNFAPPHFCHEVVTKGKCVFCRSEEERIIYEAEVLTGYLDYKEVLSWFDEKLLGRIKGGRMGNQPVLQLLSELDEGLGDWKRYKGTISLEKIRHDRDKKNTVLHTLLVAIQATIDIANHLIARHSLRRPETYRESFDVLGEAGILSSHLVDKLANLAGFRNVLVHIYRRLDLDQVYGILTKEWETLEEFEKLITKLIEEHEHRNDQTESTDTTDSTN